jgi:hypothetical protein
MSTESKARPSSDEAILEERERPNQAVLRLLANWSEPGEEQEQREALDELKRALDEDRPSGRKLFRPTETIRST